MNARPLIMLAALAVALPSCKKDDVDARVRVECWKCTATVNGESTAVSGTREWNMTVEHGAGITVSACRAPNDTIFSGADTLVTVYADAMAAFIWLNGEKYASASESAAYPQQCLEAEAPSAGSGD